VRLWQHETSRVYGDKMIEEKDMETLTKLQLQTAKDFFDVRTFEYQMCNLFFVVCFNDF
jgi:hypothetical protein